MYYLKSLISDEITEPERRAFLKKLVQAIIGFLSVLAAVVSVVFIYPAGLKQKTIKYIDVTGEDDLPRRGVKRVIYDESTGETGRPRKAIVYLAREGDSYIAMSPVCTHLGCLVNFDHFKNQFLCPCHGGKYDASGNVIGGPPPLPLTRLPMKVENGRVFVGFKA